MKAKDWDTLHTSPEYGLWRAEVYARDGWRCKVCDSKERIEAHHIYPLRTHFEKRFEVKNGVTLCRRHHRMIFGKELELAKFFTGLIEKNGVNSVKLPPSKVGDNTEPTIEGNFDEGVTTRSQRYFLEQFINRKIPCVHCGKLLTRHYFRVMRSKKFFCDSKCRSGYLKGKLPPWTKGKRIQFCLECGKATETPSSPRRIKKYCNNTCQNSFERKASNASKKTLPERDDIV